MKKRILISLIAGLLASSGVMAEEVLLGGEVGGSDGDIMLNHWPAVDKTAREPGGTGGCVDVQSHGTALQFNPDEYELDFKDRTLHTLVLSRAGGCQNDDFNNNSSIDFRNASHEIQLRSMSLEFGTTVKAATTPVLWFHVEATNIAGINYGSLYMDYEYKGGEYVRRQFCALSNTCQVPTAGGWMHIRLNGGELPLKDIKTLHLAIDNSINNGEYISVDKFAVTDGTTAPNAGTCSGSTNVVACLAL